MLVDIAAVCNVGPVRSENQDRFVVSDFEITLADPLPDAVRLGDDSRDVLMAVADGMGGVAGGALAAEAALETMAGEYVANTTARTRLEALAAAIEGAHSVLLDLAGSSGYKGMGTTLTTVLLHGESLYIAHVGDSRAYLYRGGELTCLTTDHSYWTKLRGYDADAARRQVGGNMLAQCVGGPFSSIIPELSQLKVCRDDIVLICSDGLCGVADKDAIAARLAEGGPSWAVSGLLTTAFAAGTEDNVTAVVAQIVEESLPRAVPGEILQIDRVVEVEFDQETQAKARRKAQDSNQ